MKEENVKINLNFSKAKTAEEKAKISRGMKRWWRENGAELAVGAGLGVGIAATLAYRSKGKRLSKATITPPTTFPSQANLIPKTTRITEKLTPNQEVLKFWMQKQKQVKSKGKARSNTSSKQKQTQTQPNHNHILDSRRVNPNPTKNADPNSPFKSKNHPILRSARTLGRTRARWENRAREDVSKLREFWKTRASRATINVDVEPSNNSFSNQSQRSTSNIDFSLRKAAVKVGAHMRDGKWIKGFKQTRNLAQKAQKAQQIAQSPTAQKVVQSQPAQKLIQTGELPSRQETAQLAAEQTGSYVKDLIRNPKTTIQRGFERENRILKELNDELAPPPITKGKVIGKLVEPAKQTFTDKINAFKDNPAEFLRSELAQTKQIATSDMAENLYINSGGLVGSMLGGTLGPGGALAGDLIGARVIRRGVTDTKAFVQAVKNRNQLPELEPEFGVNPKVQKFGQIVEDAKQRVEAELQEKGRQGVFDDVGGWSMGNLAGSAIGIPGSGMPFGIAGSMYAQAVEKRMKETGEDFTTAATNFIKEKVKVGNAREQQLRDEVKERWSRLIYLNDRKE